MLRSTVRVASSGGALQSSSSGKLSAKPIVPEFTAAQKLAAEAQRQAERELASAQQAVSEAVGVAKVLKKVADDAAHSVREAETSLAKKVVAVEEAKLAKKKADESALEALKTADQEANRFLEKAFDHFDVDKLGRLKPEQFPAILSSLNLPSGPGDVDEVVAALDANQNDVVSRKDWLLHMPQEMKNALHKHPQASQWAS
eukprot:TRINITY_DN20155_c0_g1_i1.p1 TRINITY_DN20155_c0_g1~~TRINITY_DN20155_c0_g1_i1.p1  ORF type:complete len:211 (+),score=46.12 TRINITY_DN20155_c0_g1_i1:31-633(+)